MKKIILLLSVFMVMCQVNVYGAHNEWRNSTGENTVLGGTSVSDIDAKTFQDIVDPLDRLLGRYQSGATVTFNSTTAIDFTRGEVSCQNTGATITRMRQNTSTTTLTNSDLDVGSNFSNSATHYVYAVADADAATFIGVISLNSSTPDSGAATYYKLLGSFGTDSSGNIIDGSIEAPAEDPDVAVGTVYDYGTSTSSSTAKTTGTFIAYGHVSVGGASTVTISNLPFGSTSTYGCSATHQDTGNLAKAACQPASATTLTVRNEHADTRTINWIAVGF